MKFTADFIRKWKHIDGVDDSYECIARHVQAAFDKWLAEQTLVYGPQSFHGFTQETQQSWHTYKNPGHTHRAYLVMPEEIEK